MEPVTTIRVAPWVSWVPDADNLVLFDGRDGTYHALNDSASHIWRLLDAGMDREQAAARLVADYGLPPAEAADAVGQVLDGALAKGLIVVE